MKSSTLIPFLQTAWFLKSLRTNEKNRLTVTFWKTNERIIKGCLSPESDGLIQTVQVTLILVTDVGDNLGQWKLDMLMADSWDWKSHQHFELSPSLSHQHTVVDVTNIIVADCTSLIRRDCEISSFFVILSHFRTWLKNKRPVMILYHSCSEITVTLVVIAV